MKISLQSPVSEWQVMIYYFRQPEESSNNFLFLSCLDHGATCRLLQQQKSMCKGGLKEKKTKINIKWLTIWELGKKTSALQKYMIWENRQQFKKLHSSNQENSTLTVRKKNKRGRTLRKQSKSLSQRLI